MNLIVFDIDDTITKSENQHQLTYVNAMKTFGITKINQNWKTYQHHTDSFILKENYENNLPQKFDFSFIPGFEKEMSKMMLELEEVSEIKGARNMIDSLQTQSEYAISFATGSLLQPAFIKLNQAGINYDPELVAASNNLFKREEIVSKAIENAKVVYNMESFDHIISVGDGIWDLKTAENLGVHFIGIGMKNYTDFKSENIKMHLEDWANFDLKQMEEVLGITKLV